MARETHAVTGAFGYSGRYIAKRLLDRGHRVITLTNSIHRANPFGGQVRAYPFHFDRPEKLTESLKGVSGLYYTYWVRFHHARFPQALIASGLSYAILRPTVLFGKEDILINNIAWMLRKFPLFGVFGDGRYRLQPIYVDDLAALAVEQGGGRENTIINAIGPETFTYRELAETIGRICGVKRRIISIPPALGYLLGWIVGRVVHDVVVTREEIEGLMADLLYVDAPPAGPTRLTDWVRKHADTLGRKYTSELARRRDRRSAYAAN